MYESPCDFEGKKQKLISLLSSTVTAYFNVNLISYLPEKFNIGRLPCFDCRIFEVPSADEASNAVLWREKDAVKNSVSMLAQHYFSHKELQGVKSDVMKDMLKTQKNVVWEDQPKFFKCGTFVKREKFTKSINGVDCVRTKISEVDVVLGEMEHENRKDFIMSKYV